MDVVYITHKGRHLGTNEKYYTMTLEEVHKLMIKAVSKNNF